MNIIVLVKSVPDPAVKVTVKNNQIVEDGLAWEPNPYDENSTEEAIRLKEKFGGKVTLITLGPKRAEETLKKQLALGADEGILVSDPAFDGSDELAVARILAAAIEKQGPYDLIFAGLTGVDWNQGVVGPAVAEHSKPEAFRDGVVVVRTSSTNWAAQLRLMAPQLLARMNETLGDGTITLVKVLGPEAPSWRHGPRTVKGRGPRDTYG